MEGKNLLRAGFGKVCITPEESMPLAGYGNVMFRMSQNVLSDIYSICIALSDEDDNTVLLFENDLINSGEEISDPIRDAVSAATGVPKSHVMVAATHTHSAPDYRVKGEECCMRYIQFVTKKATEAAIMAMADRHEAAMSSGEGKTKSLNFIRHYVCENGAYKGDNFGDLEKSPIAGHTTEADPSFRVIRFERKDAEDILLVNWQTHPHRTGGAKKYDISADLIGVMRDEVSAALHCNVIYFTGGAGNINPTSRIASENIYADYLESGKALAKHVMDLLPDLKPLKSGKIRVAENLRREPIHLPPTDRLEKAEELREIWNRDNDYWAILPLCVENGFNSPYAASALVGISSWGPTLLSVPMYAISFGDAVFVTAAFEMFDTTAKYIRDFSPFKTTIVASCCNDDNSYVPSAYGFEHGSYEVDCCFFKPGTAERFAWTYLKMLKELSNQP